MSTKDLIAFLDSPDSNITKVALENLLQFTPAASGQAFVFEEDDFKGVRAFKRLSIKSNDPFIVQNSLIALINLSDSEKVRAELAGDKIALQQYAKYITVTPKLPFVKYVCMLLTNLGREPETLSALQSGSIAALMLTTAKPQNIGDEDFDFLAIAFSEFARQGPKDLARSVPFLYPELMLHKDKSQYPSQASLNRRKGISATIKNTLFDADLHEPLGLDTPLIETILTCLKGDEQMDPEDFAKLPPLVKREHTEFGALREPSEDVQYTLLECLVLLSSSQVGRNVLREKSAYYVVRELHLATKNAELAAICENFVNMVMRGDPNANENEKDGAQDDDEDKITEVV